MNKTVLVAGGTGRLGVPAVGRLLADGHAVHALTRDPHGAAVPAGAEPVRGDFDDAGSLAAAMRGADAVIATGTAHRVGPAGEARHGANLAAAAARAGVAQLLYVSGAGAEARTGVTLLDAKHEVELRIRDAGVPATILAPAYFMENAFNPWNLAALRQRRYPLPTARPLQQVAIEDVAAFAVLAVERPERFIGRRIELASDELTGADAAERLTRLTARPYAFEHVPLEQLPPPLRPLFAWRERVGFPLDVRALHAEHPEIEWHSFERWAALQAWP
jgi:uncharacterized protein YbjT (DUF2867 family)